MNYFDWSNFGNDQARQFWTGQGDWHSGEMTNPDERNVQLGTDLFRQVFQNLVGRAPSAQELGDFQVNALPAPNFQNLGYGDISGLVNNYIQNSFAPQIASNQQTQQTSSLDRTQQLVQNLINTTMGNTAKDLSDPNSPTYQAFSGNMNNMGITPSSGAFQAGAGGTIASAGLGAASNALQSVGLPAISGIQGLSGLPLSTSQGNMDLSHLYSIGDFGLQSQLAQQMAEMAQPGWAEKYAVPLASSFMQAAGNTARGKGH